MDKDHGFASQLKDILLLHLERYEKGVGESAYSHTVYHLRNFDGYLESVSFQDVDGIGEDLVEAWLCTLEGKSARTIRGYVSSLRRFLSFYSEDTGRPVFIPPSYKADDAYVPYLFTDEEMRMIYNLADSYESGRSNKLPYITIEFPMVIRMLDSCGFRLGELLAAKMSSVNLDSGLLTLVRTKNNRQRLVPMTENMLYILRDYCRAMGLTPSSDAYLFPRKRIDEPLKLYDIRHRFRKVLVKAGIRDDRPTVYKRGPCIHCLRHRFVLRAVRKLLSEGKTIDDAVPYLSIYLGHESLNETEKYMKFSAEMFPDELDRFGDYSDGLLPDESIWDNCI